MESIGIILISKMPVIKEPKAGFGYWLKQLNDGTLGASFGYKTMQGQFAGKWLGTTYKVDYQKDFDIDGRHGTVFAKYTANCNSNRTLINSFNIELWTLEGATKGVVISLDGKNLPLLLQKEVIWFLVLTEQQHVAH